MRRSSRTRPSANSSRQSTSRLVGPSRGPLRVRAPGRGRGSRDRQPAAHHAIDHSIMQPRLLGTSHGALTPKTACWTIYLNSFGRFRFVHDIFSETPFLKVIYALNQLSMITLWFSAMFSSYFTSSCTRHVYTSPSGFPLFIPLFLSADRCAKRSEGHPCVIR